MTQSTNNPSSGTEQNNALRPRILNKEKTICVLPQKPIDSFSKSSVEEFMQTTMGKALKFFIETNIEWQKPQSEENGIEMLFVANFSNKIKLGKLEPQQEKFNASFVINKVLQRDGKNKKDEIALIENFRVFNKFGEFYAWNYDSEHQGFRIRFDYEDKNDDSNNKLKEIINLRYQDNENYRIEYHDYHNGGIYEDYHNLKEQFDKQLNNGNKSGGSSIITVHNYFRYNDDGLIQFVDWRLVDINRRIINGI